MEHSLSIPPWVIQLASLAVALLALRLALRRDTRDESTLALRQLKDDLVECHKAREILAARVDSLEDEVARLNEQLVRVLTRDDQHRRGL